MIIQIIRGFILYIILLLLLLFDQLLKDINFG